MHLATSTTTELPGFSLVDCPKCHGTGVDPDFSTANCLVLRPCKMCQESGQILASLPRGHVAAEKTRPAIGMP